MAEPSYADPVRVANFRTRFDAEVAGGLLRGAGIPFLLQSAEGMGLGPMPGGASLLVRADHLAAAREVLGLAAPDEAAEW